MSLGCAVLQAESPLKCYARRGFNRGERFVFNSVALPPRFVFPSNFFFFFLKQALLNHGSLFIRKKDFIVLALSPSALRRPSHENEDQRRASCRAIAQRLTSRSAQFAILLVVQQRQCSISLTAVKEFEKSLIRGAAEQLTHVKFHFIKCHSNFPTKN